MSAVTKCGCPDRGDKYIGACRNFLEIFGVAMADSDRAVSVQQQHSHRLADNVAAPDNHAFLAVNSNTRVVNKLHDTGRGTWQKVKVADHNPPDIDRMKRVNILFNCYCIDNRFFVKRLRQRKLHKNTVYVRPRVEIFDKRDKLILCCVGRQRKFLGMYADCFAVLLFVVDIDA